MISRSRFVISHQSPGRLLRGPTPITIHRGMTSSYSSPPSGDDAVPSPALTAVLRNRLRVHPPVQQALLEGRPVVALESTIVAHGMPFPENEQLCRRLASILRERGVEPATIALHDGQCRIGLSPEEIESLARTAQQQEQEQQQQAVKCSTRDLSMVLAAQQNEQSTAGPQWGATTVASTMVLSHAAGIATFVTGGVGGVHRNGHISMDVSADLMELGKTPVVVVSAGIKSILDIARTLEVLETQGVPVVAYQADDMPAFFSPNSGVPAPNRLDSAEQVAEAYWAARDLGLQHGMLVAVPNHDPAGANIETAIQAALAEAEKRGLHGPAVTPFVLKLVAETTGGDSLRSNMALVQRNAEVGAEIAIAIANEQRRRQERVQAQVTPSPGLTATATATATNTTLSSDVVVLGGIVLDVLAKPTQGPLLLGTSNPASCIESDGGVARNIAEALGRLGHQPVLFSAVGDDSRGRSLLQYLREECHVHANEETIRIVEGGHTATYVAVLNHSGDLHAACADMSILTEIPPPPVDVLGQVKLLVMDANPPISVLRQAARSASEIGTPVYFEPTSVPKAMQVAQDDAIMSRLTCAFPNADELLAMATPWKDDTTGKEMNEATESARSSAFKDMEEQASVVLARMNSDGEARLVITLGENGVLLASRNSYGDISFEHFPAHHAHLEVENSTGAGDSLCGAYIHAILNGKTAAEAVRMGMKAAVLSLSSRHAISADIL